MKVLLFFGVQPHLCLKGLDIYSCLCIVAFLCPKIQEGCLFSQPIVTISALYDTPSSVSLQVHSWYVVAFSALEVIQDHVCLKYAVCYLA
jgi:hypothetical protein